MSDFQRILLIKPSSLGDIVHTLPVVAALKQHWPEAHLTWCVKRQWAEVVERVEGVDRVWPIDFTVRGWTGSVPALRRQRFDLVLDLQGLLRSAALAWLTGCPTRVGFANGREGSPWFYSRRVAVPMPEMHAVDRYLLMVAALGAAVQGRPQFRFRLPSQDYSAVGEVLRRKGVNVDAPWVAMNISARWPTKRWPVESFAAVAAQLSREGVGPIVVIGGPDERREGEQMKRLADCPVIDLIGETTLGILPALLSKASLLITNDSGPMHVAAAVGTPVVSVFGPTSAVRTGPYGEGHAVLTHEIPCRPCFSRVCRNAVQMECLQRIIPAQVVAAVRDRWALRMVPR
ncbi:MAG: glycosyltransferase family 9 protein [Nitrospira sp.]|jgi:heptosyltransferase-1|nr:glycosyltransferase family 9 protein [Nitrospira sp.]